MKILIAEDDFVSRKLLFSQLSFLGDVDIAANGKEAILAVQLSHSENKPYDLIFLDIIMPESDGIKALADIRRLEFQAGLDKAHSSIIVMLTAHSEKDHVVAAAKSNCDCYLIKPVAKQRLYDKLRELGFDI